MSGKQYTIRFVPDRIDRELRRRAKAEGKSLNSVVLEVLESALTPPGEPVLYHDLDHLIGTWVEDPAFDEAMKDCERIDEEMWQ